jgi:hypothetical protein
MRTFYCQAAPAFYAMTALKDLGSKVDIAKAGKCVFNPLKPELNPICYLLALLEAHHFLHVSRIRVKLLTLR